MIRKKIVIVMILILTTALLPLPGSTSMIAQANEGGFTRIDGEIRGYPYSLFRPDDWNGDLVLLVHGSIPLWFEIFADVLVDQGFGVAFTTITEIPGPAEGQALKEVTINTRIVQNQFTANFGHPTRTYLFGFSRGAHNMTKLVETTPEQYDGVFVACGGSPVAWDYFFTARALFDYFYPGVLPGQLLSSPISEFSSYYLEIVPLIVAAIEHDTEPAEKMAQVDQYGIAYSSMDELINGIVDSLVVHTAGVNSLIAAANGNPFDNTNTVYTGTNDDPALNAGVARIKADPQASNYLSTWSEPNGDLGATPYLVLHTSRDWTTQERFNDLYEALVNSTGNGEYYHRRVIDRFGHCAFTFEEVMGGFADLVNWVETGAKPGP
jgi:pimeloyl-ACP methyl ester carboxylesterase